MSAAIYNTRSFPTTLSVAVGNGGVLAYAAVKALRTLPTLRPRTMRGPFCHRFGGRIVA